MRYFLGNHKASLIRFGAGVLLSLVALTLCLVAAPAFAPDGMHNIIPFAIYGVLAMFITACIVITMDESALQRIGAVALASFLSFVVGGIIGSDAGMDVAQNPAYGWYFGATCGILALIGGGVGFVFPRAAELSDLQTGWSVAIHRHY